MSVETLEDLPPRRRLAAHERRAAILTAAVDVFAARGYGPPAMAEIAEEAGITRAVLYDHFASKRDLFLAALSEQSAIFLGHVGAHISGEGASRERMQRTVDAVFSFAETRPAAWSLLYKNDVHGDDDVDRAWLDARRSRSAAVTELLAADLQNAGLDVRTPHAALVVEMLVGALTAAAGEWQREFPSVAREDIVNAAMRLLWSGMSRLS